MAKTRALFFKADASVREIEIAWHGEPTWNIPVYPGRPPYWEGTDEPLRQQVLPVEVYVRLGQLPTGVQLFGHQPAGFTVWNIDQVFHGPDKNRLVDWQRTIADQDGEMDANVKYFTGIEHWPGRPDYPPYHILHQETRHLVDTGNMYQRRTQGVAMRRIM
jgi:hypothetical protein